MASPCPASESPSGEGTTNDPRSYCPTDDYLQCLDTSSNDFSLDFCNIHGLRSNFQSVEYHHSRRPKHMSLFAVYAPTKVCGADEHHLTLFWISASVGTHSLSWTTSMLPLALRIGYELCVGPHGSGIGNTNSFLLQDFAKSRRMIIAGSWYERPELHRWTWLVMPERVDVTKSFRLYPV